MTSPTGPSLPPPPQIGRTGAALDRDDDQSGLWSQLLAVFRDLGGAFDPFANDADAQVRALGRLARRRHPPQADDYFALGDLCARLTLQNTSLSDAYAAKTIAAYVRGAALAPGEARTARAALVAFARWVAQVAGALGNDEALKVGMLVCERVRQIALVARNRRASEQVRAAEARLRDQLGRWIEDEQTTAARDPTVAARESRLLCDRGQMLLRQSQAAQALALFERALQIDGQNHTAWLWRAMALTDLGRFDAALASYDRALALDPENAGVWNSKGALLMELGRVEPALECFERAIALGDAAGMARAIYWLNKGKALFRLGRYQEALLALECAHQLEPAPESAAGIAASRERLALQAGC